MSHLLTAVAVIQVISAIAILILVLLQHGKGADMGAAFGSGASGSLFGASGSSNFLSKFTGVAAVIFFGATLALAFYGNPGSTAGGGVMEKLSTSSAPAAKAPAPVAGAPGTPVTPENAPAITPATAPKISAPAAPAGQANQIPK